MSIGFGMKALSRNVIVLMFKERVVGIVAVHEPGQRIDMNEEMEFLFNHLLYEEGFHQTGPVIGIITTLEEWQLCWLPAHTEYFTTGTSTNSSAASHIDTTGVDTDTGADTGTDTTPLQPADSAYSWTYIQSQNATYRDSAEHTTDTQEELEITEESVKRLLHTSPVVNTHKQYELLLQYLCSALTYVTERRPYYKQKIPPSLFVVYRGENADRPISFHPVSALPLQTEHIHSTTFPGSRCSRLLVLKDLGRGSTGKAYLACTLSTSSSTSSTGSSIGNTGSDSAPALCVLKYAIAYDESWRLRSELQWWGQVYPDFQELTGVDIWDGDLALMMPYFAPIPTEQREQYRKAIYKLLFTTFHSRGFHHLDVRWANIGVYVDKTHDKVPVLFDLERMQSVTVESEDVSWVTESMKKLYE